MAIDFNKLLSPDQKRDILEKRISQFATEAYQLTLNKQTADQLQNTDEQKEKIDNALAILERAIDIHQQEIAKLD